MRCINLIVIFILALLVLACGSGSSVVRPTAAPHPTAIPTDAPTAAPIPSETPAPTETPEARYLSIAQAGALPVVRAGLPKGIWQAHTQDLGQGPEVQIMFPMTVGLSNEQTARQAKLQGAGIMKRLFDADPALARLNIIGTLPDGANQAEQPAVSLLIERAAYAQWDGTADSLPWQVSARLQ